MRCLWSPLIFDSKNALAREPLLKGRLSTLDFLVKRPVFVKEISFSLLKAADLKKL
jgi:hypothetical protein